MQSIPVIIRITSESEVTKPGKHLLFAVHSPLDSRRLNLYTTHSGQVPYYCQNCIANYMTTDPEVCRVTFHSRDAEYANADIQRMGILELRPYGTCLHANIIEQSTTCSVHQLPSCLCCLLTQTTHTNSA